MKTAILQMNSGDCPEENLQSLELMVCEAAQAGAQLVASPEASLYMGRDKGKHLEIPGKSAGLCRCSELARKLGIFLHLGSCYTSSPDPERFYNESFFFGPDGKILANYAKTHCFDVSIHGRIYRESRHIEPGNKLVTCPIQVGSEHFVLGFAICYDLRFADLFHTLSRKGANLFLVPSAFTQASGELHWHILLRSRALDYGSYVLAPSQCGESSEGCSYGHALIVDPCGHILAEAGEQPEIIYAELREEEIQRQEESFGVRKNRRDDLYIS